MSGIAGFYGIDADAALLQRLCAAQPHRGDGVESHIDQALGIACQGRSTTASAGSPSLAQSEDGRFVLALDGTLYNYEEIIDLLLEEKACPADEGSREQLRTDAQIMLAAYRAWGLKALDRFNGLFALAIWDHDEQELVLARDHFGVKPLYFARIDDRQASSAVAPTGAASAASASAPTQAGGLMSAPTPGGTYEGTPAAAPAAPSTPPSGPAVLFASQLTPLVRSGLLTPKPNDRIVYRYLRFRVHDDSPETFFAGIYRLLPGECALIGPEGMQIQRYSSLQDELMQLASEEAVADQRAFSPKVVSDFRKLLWRSVRLRLRSTGRVGSTLSGGMDSSAVTAIICDQMRHLPEGTEAVGEVQQAFSAVFPHSINDEERYIDAVAARYPQTLKVNKTTPRPKDFLADLTDFIATQEEPLISTGPYAQYSVMKAASGRVDVLLDGEGADEMLAGYVPYYLVYFRQLKRRGHWLKLAKEVVLASDKMLRLVRFRLRSKLSHKRHFDEGRFLDAAFSARFVDERLNIVSDNLKLRLLNDLFRDSTPCSIRYVDRNTARFGLEGRQPFLDTELVRFIFSQNDEAIIKDSWNKRLLSDAISDILPSEVWARRNKIGFSTPEDEWFEVLKDTVRELFLSESFAARPYFDRDAVLEAFDAFADGTGEASTMTFWRLLNVELWLREFIDQG
ncbi:MAG: hypothetical protein LBI64_06845 [Coriobacteriales bacterium]|jgi:asparagine synthase (glutamine-hydrolysing)|nr:hypothetical protein [Coriobacteriales bacterium]